MRIERNTKILATLGPATATRKGIEDLYRAGANAFRLNFSHGTHEGHRQAYDWIREVEAGAEHPIGVIADLQGPKLRVSRFKDGGIDLTVGQTLRLALGDGPGDADGAFLPHPEVFAVLKPDMEVLLDDGRIRLRITHADKTGADTEVITGGRLTDHKGLNLPGAVLPLNALTTKDRRDLDFAVALGADWIALSFVQRPEDVAEARKLAGGRCAIMAKIEKPAAVERFGEIIDLADGIMVARGDLGVEMLPEEVPSAQKYLVRAAREAGKPVVVATQMLESMVHAPAPTRAEASDVATAVYEGADCLMLSAETAVGEFPNEAVRIMDRVIRRVERDPLLQKMIAADDPLPQATAPDAISAAAHQVAETIGAAAIVTYTQSGATALRAARERPVTPIVALVPELRVARRLSLVWGLRCVRGEDAESFDDMIERATRSALFRGYAPSDSRIVITAGVPFGTPGATNLLHIAWVPSFDERRVAARKELL